MVNMQCVGFFPFNYLLSPELSGTSLDIRGTSRERLGGPERVAPCSSPTGTPGDGNFLLAHKQATVCSYLKST